MQQSEIEIICLLGNQEHTDEFIENLTHYGEQTGQKIIAERQLNHFFSGGMILDVYHRFSSRMPLKEQEELHHICIHGQRHSIRTYAILPGNRTFLEIKAAQISHLDPVGLSKLQFSYELYNTSLEELDREIMDLGREYVAKQTKIMTNYKIDDISINVDQTPGLGFMITFETKLQAHELHEDAIGRLRDLLLVLKLQECSQEQLAAITQYHNNI